MSAVNECSDGLDSDVGDEDEIADRDQLLRSTFGGVRVCASRTEAPQNDEAGDALDEAVEPEPDQRDRRGSDARTDGDRKLSQMPCIPAPREQPRPADEDLSLRGRRNVEPSKRLNSYLSDECCSWLAVAVRAAPAVRATITGCAHAHSVPR